VSLDSLATLSNVTISRRNVLGGLALAPALAALGGVAARRASAQDGGQITMVTDTAGIDDGNFNTLSWNGVQAAAAEFGYTAAYLESIDPSNFYPNLTEAAETSVIVVAVGFNLVDDLTEVAPQYPDVSFVIIDAVVEADNVESFLFKEQEGAFLGGIAAAMYSTSKQLGIVGGEEIPPVVRYEVGYTAGARTILGNDWQPQVNYVGSFGDPAGGLSAANAQFDQGADIIFPIAGLTNNGVFEAARTRSLPNSVIGVDTDQRAIGATEQLFFIGKALDVAVRDAVQDYSQGSFAGGVNNLGLIEGGVSVGDPDGKLSAEITAAIELYRQAVVSGEIVVPVDRETLAAFTPIVLEAAGTPEAGTPEATPGATPEATPAS
jgi:basic membrane protein A and related proteins